MRHAVGVNLQLSVLNYRSSISPIHLK